MGYFYNYPKKVILSQQESYFDMPIDHPVETLLHNVPAESYLIDQKIVYPQCKNYFFPMNTQLLSQPLLFLTLHGKGLGFGKD